MKKTTIKTTLIEKNIVNNLLKSCNIHIKIYARILISGTIIMFIDLLDTDTLNTFDCRIKIKCIMH